MAVYKVPQDVEAEDKLIGPLSFRQFIYAGIALGAATIAFFLFQVFPLLAIIPLPIVFLFGILALPLRKDQPMETYLLALLRFYLKSKMRIWNPDGTITYVEITVPKEIEQHLTKDFTGTTAQERLDYLARIMDTRGWASKGVIESTNSVRPDITAEVQSTNDVMDENASLSQSINNLIVKNDQQRIANARQQMATAAQQPQPPQQQVVTTPQQTTAPAQPAPTVQPAQQPPDDNIALHYNPYPSAMHQKVVHTIEEQQEAEAARAAALAAAKPNKPIPKPVSPDIIRLARNDDLSISAIANEARRLQDKEEVVINLH